MERKGELKAGGLPALFRNFATENFSGVLTLTSSVGEKLITLTESEITIYVDELCETSRLGNILLTRGKLTEDQLQKILKDQRALEPRPRLGDLLISRGVVTEQACADARRFQVEEDICDALSWKDAKFIFAKGESAREIHPEDFAPEQVHRVSIDPDSFFKSVKKLSDDWGIVGDRLPTQYLCFKLSLRADSQNETLSKDAQTVLRHIKEGRTVEGVVKQSCLGRISVCTEVIGLLEKGLILPASGAELRFRASEHRAQKRYHDALYIYRRLLESPDARDERQYLENLIAEISDQIVQEKQHGDYGEEALIVSHKQAKEKYFRTQNRNRLAALIGGGVVVIVAGWFLLQMATPKKNVSEEYRQAIQITQDAAEQGDFTTVQKTWIKLLENFEPESETARKIKDYLARIPDQINLFIERKIPTLEEQLNRGGDERKQARTALLRLKEEYPQNSSDKKIDTLLEKFPEIAKPETGDTDPADVKVSRPGTLATRGELIKKLKSADDLMQQKRFRAARRDYEMVTADAPVNDEIWKQADASIKNIQALDQKQTEEAKRIEALAANDGEKAIEAGNKMIAEYGDLDAVLRMQQVVTRLQFRKNTGEYAIKSAHQEEEGGRIFDSVRHYEQVAERYPEFSFSKEAAQRAVQLRVKVEELKRLLGDALEAVKSGDFREARRKYTRLLEKNSQMLIDQRVDLPVYVTSEPAGASIKLNGESQGKTPANLLIKAGNPFEIEISRPGFRTKKLAGEHITVDQLDLSVRLQLEPLSYEFPFPFFVPPYNQDGHVVLLNGNELVAYDPPSHDPLWKLKPLFDERRALPEGAEDRMFWHCRLSPIPFKPGQLLLPMRNKELWSIDIHAPESPKKDVVMTNLPAEIAGTLHIEEHSMLAGKSLLTLPLADGTVRCYEEFEKLSNDRHPTERWTATLDPQEMVRREAPAAGLHVHRGQLCVVSAGGSLCKLDPLSGNILDSVKFQNMSPHTAFSTVRNDGLTALVQRNGRVIVVDLDQKLDPSATLWDLPARQGMEESVSVLIDESGVFVTTRRDESGELRKYARHCDPGSTTPKLLWSVKLDGHCDQELARGKHLYLITHFNKVFAYTLNDGRQIWEFKVEPEYGEPVAVRAIGENVVVTTNKGRAIVLKAD